MSELGKIGWIDLTVPDAEAIRDFYQHVAGWDPSPVAMGGYQDYCMTPPGTTQPVAGICHARGHNADLPPAWLIYVTVADLDEAVRRCHERGGKVRHPARDMGGQGRYAIIEDPAGAVAALFEPSGE
jgi:predicted enzyme related to lactoylglutathione lyase